MLATVLNDQIVLNRAIRWLEVVLVILLAFSVARLASDLMWFSPASNSGTPSEVIPPTLTSQPQFISDGRVNVQVSPALAHLFGTTTTPTETATIGQPLQQTNLNLVLKGILADRDSGNRFALIAAGGAKEQVFRIGDKIAGAEIIGIEARRVVIRRNGVNEALDLEVRKLAGKAVNASVVNRVEFNNGIRQLSDTDRAISRNTLSQQLNNLPSLLQQARAIPHSEGGEQIGFRIVELKQGSVFEQLGIRQNDIIYAVNGTPIRNTEDALNAYRNMATTSTFRIGLLRNGQDIKLNLAVQ
jgi:general secretion pathway protein C